MLLTPIEAAAFHTLAVEGALSVTALDAGYWNYELNSSWHGLQDAHLIQVYQTTYGSVVGLTDHGRAHARTFLSDVPDLSAPASVANRAYLNDALRLLYSRGYKPSTDPPTFRKYPHSPTRQTHTSEIISCTIRIPDSAYADVSYRPSRAPHSMLHLPYFRPGQPRLYASIATGGITPKQGEVYLKRHKHHLLYWQTPLLLVVPDPAPFASLLARQVKIGGIHHHPNLQLITLPIPSPQIQYLGAEPW
ncbi:hypothetical protein HNQ07_004110 [Deinococcus metalli]|uniref:Uncharacterized protein n=1 Tax=Deinococcus metalli TaxID=1141878 RepID=A0A7W8NT22_9DEIO|nr:hypothetical protein [Deinococcus metalli]MBB5378603.1 hypothetical protein [Deinococcus metalli]GHF61082.1 hypothetical protein GCM10017781_41520 [Deinococcus metalli]